MSTHLSSGVLQLSSNGQIHFNVKKFYLLDVNNFLRIFLIFL
jgi:hypothetical protein